MYHHRFVNIDSDFPGFGAKIRQLSVFDLDFAALVEDYSRISAALRHSDDGVLWLSEQHFDELLLIHARMRTVIQSRLMQDHSAI